VWALSERNASSLAHHSRAHSDHSTWLNDLAGAMRRVASRRGSALRINGSDAMANEHGVVPEYHDRTYSEGGRRTEFKSVAFLNRRRHA
jgi:hypothetical protein